MFQPKIFRDTRLCKLHSMIGQYPFSTLVTNHRSGVTADHVPLMLSPKVGRFGTLQGHLAAVNPLCRDSQDDREALAIFHGPSAYVSAGWYPSKPDNQKVVPTWNYVVIHARGKLRFIQDAEWKLRHLNTLTNQHEAGRDDPWTVSQAPDDFVARQLRAIVGFEITIEDLTGTVKISQNKSRTDLNGVISGLETEAPPAKDAMFEFMSAYYGTDDVEAGENGSVSSNVPNHSNASLARKMPS